MGMLENDWVETGMEEAAAYLASVGKNTSSAAKPTAAQQPSSTALAFIERGVDTTVNPAPARAPAAVETAFVDLDGTPSPVQPPALTVDTEADTGEDPDFLDALAVGLLPNKSTTNWNAVTAFMGAVMPWPGEQDPGFVNLHHNVVVNGKLYKGGGWPMRTVDRFVARAAAMNGWTNFKGAWFCTSLQRDTKPGKNKSDKPKAHRLAANAMSLKSIWIDVDVGPNKLYPDVKAAIAAVFTFCTKHSLPTPSAMVGSGNGLHVYWISKTPLTPAEWNGYAQGSSRS
jgi:hypothetical protein